MASSSAPQTRELVSTSVALTAETTSPHTGGCGVTTARSVKPKFFMARAAAPMLFGSRGRTSTILLCPIFLTEGRRDGETDRWSDVETLRIQNPSPHHLSVSPSLRLSVFLYFLACEAGVRT